MDTSNKNALVKEYVLQEDQELRFEALNDEVVVELVDGTCEAFGAELVQHKRYSVPAQSRVALFTWHGCTLELVGRPDGAYVAKHTPMVIYLNTHAALEQMRQQADRDNSRGPRIMLAGPTDVGKTSYCKVLVNYAVRLGRCLTFVDLDIGQNGISMPGSVAALYVERPGDPIEGFDKKAPLVYHFGHKSPGVNITFYNTVVNQLAKVVEQRCRNSKTANVGGVIINTCGWVKGDGYECLRNAAEAFEVDVIVVLDHERLYNELQKDMPQRVKVVHQPKSGGVEERSQEARMQARRRKVRQYFYGTDKQPLFPHTVLVPFDQVHIFKIGQPKMPDSLMPLGMKPEDTSLKVVPVSLDQESLLNRILALSLCESVSDDLARTNLAGFVCVTAVNAEERTLVLLSPQPPPLPRNILLWTDVDFVDLQ